MIKINKKYKIPFFEILSLILFFIVFFGISFVIFTFVGIGFLSFLGFEYKSVGSVILFFAIYFLIGSPIDFLCTSFLDIFRYVNKLPYKAYKIIESLIDILLTFITVNIIDLFMNSISIPTHTEILFAILSYLLSECVDVFDIGKNKDSSEDDK
ncbi:MULTISPECIES: regulatory YrvL family protein [unclassified Romboutsia]|uniref:regulatory YrvL family protein n=1 Tax=unclassified Romboutsia TaxID=2626894 RepID=UPI0008209E8B|nr:regulatory YrvL family protein [Romboutsia sp. Marseille-P6047]SCH03136.1 Uncharacterised protein [uncultured Clostridium sp.]